MIECKYYQRILYKEYYLNLCSIKDRGIDTSLCNKRNCYYYIEKELVVEIPPERRIKICKRKIVNIIT